MQKKCISTKKTTNSRVYDGQQHKIRQVGRLTLDKTTKKYNFFFVTSLFLCLTFCITVMHSFTITWSTLIVITMKLKHSVTVVLNECQYLSNPKDLPLREVPEHKEFLPKHERKHTVSPLGYIPTEWNSFETSEVMWLLLRQGDKGVTLFFKNVPGIYSANPLREVGDGTSFSCHANYSTSHMGRSKEWEEMLSHSL
jgi:hypothetical protein